MLVGRYQDRRGGTLKYINYMRLGQEHITKRGEGRSGCVGREDARRFGSQFRRLTRVRVSSFCLIPSNPGNGGISRRNRRLALAGGVEFQLILFIAGVALTVVAFAKWNPFNSS